MYPMKLKPVYKNYIWGGTRLREEFGKDSESICIAESWELSCHKDGENVIADGEYAGMTLSDYISQNRETALGGIRSRFEQFPVLIKLIDACDRLSVQVHPDDEYALRNEGDSGKTEMWYVIDCQPDAEIIYGFNKKISKNELSERIKNNTLLEVLNRVKVKKGDVYFIEAGTIHGIGAGIIIAEIQQNSNSTYRVYDYGRKDVHGNFRELHIQKALDVVSLDVPAKAATELLPENRGAFIYTLLVECGYFKVEKYDLLSAAEVDFKTSASFHSILVIEGKCNINGTEFKKGESCFIPAGTGKYTVSGKSEIILTSIIT